MTEEFLELLNRKEELLPELKQYLEELKGVGTYLRHPLLYNLWHTPEQNALMNARYKEKVKHLTKSLHDRKWGSVLAIHERPFRVQAFVGIEMNLDNKEYWETLSWLWTDSENIWQNNTLWRKLLSSDRPERQYFMDGAERKFFASLPETIKVYRGYQKGKNFGGISHTLDKEKAQWFANRYAKGTRAAVCERTIKKSKVFAYLAGRGEQEILIL